MHIVEAPVLNLRIYDILQPRSTLYFRRSHWIGLQEEQSLSVAFLRPSAIGLRALHKQEPYAYKIYFNNQNGGGNYLSFNLTKDCSNPFVVSLFTLDLHIFIELLRAVKIMTRSEEPKKYTHHRNKPLKCQPLLLCFNCS